MNRHDMRAYWNIKGQSQKDTSFLDQFLLKPGY